MPEARKGDSDYCFEHTPTMATALQIAFQLVVFARNQSLALGSKRPVDDIFL